MKKVILLIMAFSVLLISLNLVSANNRIFAGSFNETAFEITPITPAYESVEAYEQGDSDFYIMIYPSHNQYRVSEGNLDDESEEEYVSFYFIADVPENTNRIDFYHGERLLSSLNTAGEVSLNDFNITYNGRIDFSWQTILSSYYASIYYEDNGLWIPLIFEMPYNGSSEAEIPLDWFSFSGYSQFKLIISDGFNEVEDYFWFNVPYISWCNGADFNQDGVVDASDYITLKRNFGKSNATNSMGDADSDRSVGFNDLQLLQSNIGGGNCSQVIFPEVNLSEYEGELVLAQAPEIDSGLVNSGSRRGSSAGNSVVIGSADNGTNSYGGITTAEVIKLEGDNSKSKMTSSLSSTSLVRIVGIIRKIFGFLFS